MKICNAKIHPSIIVSLAVCVLVLDDGVSAGEDAYLAARRWACMRIEKEEK